MSADEERRLKRQMAVGREVQPEELPTELRIFRLEGLIEDQNKRIEYLEQRDNARGLSGIMIGGPSND